MRNAISTFVIRATAALGLLFLLATGAKASNVGGPSDHPAPRPDLTISQVSRVYNRYTGQVVPDRMWVQISNIGNAGTGGFQVFTEWGQGSSNQMGYFVFPSGLAAYQSAWIQIDAQGYDLWNGNFLVWADSTKVVTESDETNNVYEHSGP